MLFLGLGLGLIKLYHYCTTSTYFSIEHIDINGNKILTEEDILTLSGIHKGENILIANIPDIERRLLQNPWVEQVSIQRKLPNQFFIDINERIAKFWVLRQGSIYYLDDEGKFIAPVNKHNFQSLPMLDIGSGGEEALGSLPGFMERVVYAQLPFDLSQISWLKLSAAKGFELYWENKQLSLSIGIEDWNGKLQRLTQVITDMENRKEIAKIREIRAADGQVWLQKI
jgi:cell division protein FtsQ